MEEDFDFSTIQADPSIKQKLLENSQQQVPLDYFMYEVWEQEGVIRSIYRADIPRRQSFLPQLSEEDKNDPAKLASNLDAMWDWYLKHVEYLSHPQPLSFDHLAPIVEGIAHFATDLKAIVQSSGQDINPLEGETNPAWNTLKTWIEQKTGPLARYLTAYLKWSFSTPNIPPLDLSSLPPVGWYAHLIRQTFKFPGDRKGRGENFRRDEGPRGGRSNHHQDKPQRNGSGGPKKRSPGPKLSPNPRAAFQQGPNKGGKPPRNKPQPSGDHKLAEVLAEVAEGIARLNKDTRLSWVQLKPQNSYLRRLQHKEVGDRGFFSISVGDTVDRAVRILREKPEGEQEQ